MEAVVEYSYTAKEPDELTLRKGDIIKEIKVMVGGWWEGTLKDRRGMFPDNFVKVLEPLSPGTTCGTDSVSNAKSEEVVLRNGASTRRWCKVLFSYEPCNEDELTLVPQDTIEFLSEVEEGWWRGRLRGRVGVFPSNFVTPPTYDEQDKHREREKKEICRVLFPYDAANEDELTLVEGDVIVLLSKDALDKGWWKGELKGQVGLFPDNFVEIINVKGEHQDQEQWHETNQLAPRSIAKHSHQLKKIEKAHVRKSLDVRNVHADHFSSVESTKKTMATSLSSTTSTSSLATIGSGSGGAGSTSSGGDKKPHGNHPLVSSLKRHVSEGGSNNGNGSTNVGLEDELDGVERGEGAPLSHLTAFRAKAPHRRLPSSQRLRHRAAGSAVPATNNALTTGTLLEDNLSNGNTETNLESLTEHDGEGLAAKARKMVPWVEELKMNQLERKKIGSVDRMDKGEVRKEKALSRVSILANFNIVAKTDLQEVTKTTEDSKQKEKEKRLDAVAHTETSSTPVPDYVPYHVYNQLLERIATLEEKQAILQQTVSQLSEQLAPLLANSSVNNKV